MGGTSADIGIVTERGISEASARDTWVAGYPLLVPMIDIHTIGAGGGSIAYVDEGGAFRVGPRSAGRDARARPATASGGDGADDHRRERRARPDRPRPLPRRRDAARPRARPTRPCSGSPTSSGSACSRPRRGSSRSRTRTWPARSARAPIQKGHDPREFALVAFGGAGPLHAAEVADSLGIPEVLVPPYPGITSATGLLTSDLKYDQMRTVFMIEGAIDAERAQPRARGARRGAARPAARGRRGRRTRSRSRPALDCRYVGQGYELRVAAAGRSASRRRCARGVPPPARAGVRPRVPRPDRDRQPARDRDRRAADGRAAAGRRGHARRGAARRGRERLPASTARSPRYATRYYERVAAAASASRFDGPAVVFQRDTTIVVPPGWTARAQTRPATSSSRR